MAIPRQILLWLLVGTGGGGLGAQSPSAGPTEFEFSVMASARMPAVGFARLKPEARSKARPVAADFEIVPLRISSQGRSDLHTYPGPLPLRIVATAPQLEGSGLRAVRTLGVLSGPRVPPRALLLLRPDPVSADNWDVILLDDTAAGFPARHLKVVNLSDDRVEGRIDATSFTTSPAQSVLPAQRVGERVRIGAAYDRGGVPTVFFDQSLQIGESERVLLVVLPPFRPGADLRLRVVREQLFQTEPAAAD